MNTPRNPKTQTPQAEPAISFTRVIAVAPRIPSFDGWGPTLN